MVEGERFALAFAVQLINASALACGADDFDAAVLGHGLPPAAEQALREAGLLRHDPPAEMAALMRAQALAQWYAKALAPERRDVWLLMSEQFVADATSTSSSGMC